MGGFLGGLGNFISTAGPIAAQIGGDYEQAQAQGSQQRNQQALSMLALQRQQRQDAIENALKQSQTGEANARIGDIAAQQGLRQYQMEHPKPTDHYSTVPNMFDANGNPIGGVLDTTTGKVAPTGFAGKPLPVPKDPTPHFTAQVITAPDGTQHIARFNTLTGQIDDTGTASKQPRPVGAPKVDPNTKMAQDHYGRAKAASDALDQFGGTVASNGQVSNFIMGHNPFDSTLQQANQAGDEFATLMAPILNKGRTTHVEVDLVRKSYVPSASDSPATIQQKSQARAALLRQYAPQIQAALHSPSPSGSSGDPVLDEFGITPVRKK